MGREPDIFEQVRAAGLITGLTIILVLLASGGTSTLDVTHPAVLLVLFLRLTAPLSTTRSRKPLNGARSASRHRRLRRMMLPSRAEEQPVAPRGPAATRRGRGHQGRGGS